MPHQTLPVLEFRACLLAEFHHEKLVRVGEVAHDPKRLVGAREGLVGKLFFGKVFGDGEEALAGERQGGQAGIEDGIRRWRLLRQWAHFVAVGCECGADQLRNLSQESCEALGGTCACKHSHTRIFFVIMW